MRGLREATQLDVARAAGVRQPTVSSVESGAPGTELATVFALLEFRYDYSWLSSPDAYAMSLALPLSERPYRDAVHTVLDNLLPDEPGVRQVIAARMTKT